MMAPMTERQKASIRSLMVENDRRFNDFLAWLSESREMTHQKMYESLQPQYVSYLQGEAKTLFDVVTKCHEAFQGRGEPAIQPLPETPGGM